SALDAHDRAPAGRVEDRHESGHPLGVRVDDVARLQVDDGRRHPRVDLLLPAGVGGVAAPGDRALAAAAAAAAGAFHHVEGVVPGAATAGAVLVLEADREGGRGG